MFEPWVGTQWGQSDNAVGGRRLMVLGESHYGSPEHPEHVETCDPGMTRRVIEDLALSGAHRFFSNILQLITGRSKSAMSRDEVRGLWHSVAFYNYVPVLAAPTSRVAPTPEMFALGREPFLRVLERLRPEAIVVCGYRLWGPMYQGLPADLQDDATGQPFRRIGSAIAARMKHPSAAFSALDQHRAVIEGLFRRIDADRARSTV